MVKMNPMEDKDFSAGGNYFQEGVYKVVLADPKHDVSKSGSDFVQFTAYDPETDAKADVRLYVTEKAAEYTRRTLAGIVVHNVEGDAAKDKVRTTFKAITDTDELIDAKFLKKFENMEAWLLVKEDLNAPKPNGGFYLRYDLYSYEPKPKKLTPEDIMGAPSTPHDPDEVPFGE